jgi:hypothetical protein
MVNAEPGAGVGHISRRFFSRKFRGMDPDDRQVVREFAFEIPQLRNDVDAIDSAVGPEVENDDFAAQLPDRQRRRIEPLEIGRKFRSANGAGVEIWHAYHLGPRSTGRNDIEGEV